MSKLLDLSDSDDDSKLKINSNCAETSDSWRRKEESQKGELSIFINFYLKKNSLRVRFVIIIYKKYISVFSI